MDFEAQILFTDTNGFLQVRDLKDLPWRDLFPNADAVDVMVAPRVIEELDKHKSSTNQRRRDRARAALQLIEKASLEPDLALVIREKPIRLRIVISTAPRLDWEMHPNLDPTKPDDHLVAEALAFGQSAIIFSHDTGPRIRARIAKIRSFAPPSEWLLPMEQTDDQRKITKLEKDLRQALSRSPIIVAGFKNFDDSTSKIQLIRPVLPRLDPQIVRRLADEHISKHPRHSFHSDHDRKMLLMGGITESDVLRYQSEYESFKTNTRNYYENLHERVKRAGRTTALEYFARNDSGVAAEGLRIEFSLEGNASLVADREDTNLSSSLFQMPKPPDELHPVLLTPA